jgi:hypothetical protein
MVKTLGLTALGYAVDVTIIAGHLSKMLIQAGIQKMSISKRMGTMDKLWVSIFDSAADVPSPDWHKEILENRAKEIKDGKAEWMTLEELRAALRLPEK